MQKGKEHPALSYISVWLLSYFHPYSSKCLSYITALGANNETRREQNTSPSYIPV